MINLRNLHLLALTAALALFAAACGDSNVFDIFADDSSSQAIKDKCEEALDSGNNNAAIEACLDAIADAPNDLDTKVNLAAAYAGSAGLDYIELVQAIDDAQQAANNGVTSSFYDVAVDMFGTLVDDQGQPYTDLQGKSDNFEKALDVLAPKDENGVRNAEGLDNDAVVQAGIYAAAQVVTLISEITGVNDISPEGLKAHGNFTADELNYNADVADTVKNDLTLLLEAETVLANSLTAADNDLANDLDTFLTQIGFKDDKNVTAEEMASYLNNSIIGQ